MNSRKLENKVALIAGASSGINLGIAAGLAAEGARVSILSRDPDRIGTARARVEAAGGIALDHVADVRDFAQLDGAMAATAEAFGPIDIVVSGAAGNFLARAEQLSANGFKTVVDIDLLGTFNVFRAAFPYLAKAGASLIAVTAPQAERATAMQAHACAAKAGVNMLCKVLALEWGEYGVRVNAISPGPIAGTEGVARLWPSGEALAALQASIPLRALGEEADVVEAAIYLASPAARYVTGVILSVDGGYAVGDSCRLGVPQ